MASFLSVLGLGREDVFLVGIPLVDIAEVARPQEKEGNVPFTCQTGNFKNKQTKNPTQQYSKPCLKRPLK